MDQHNKSPSLPKVNVHRRKTLVSLSALGVGSLLSACGGGSSNNDDSSSSSTTTSTTSGTSTTTTSTSTNTQTTSTTTNTGSCALIPEETAGPYPLYSSLGEALNQIYRQDITEDRTGIPMDVVIHLVDINNDCAPIENAYVYLWHCDKDGAYSGYSSNQNGSFADDTFLRGVYLTNNDGQVTFNTIYPGWYSGRITHMHFRVYVTNNGVDTLEATSQIAFPQSITEAVYNTDLYTSHGQNSSVGSFAEDNIFSDGTEYQLATVTGNVNDGFTAILKVGVAL